MVEVAEAPKKQVKPETPVVTEKVTPPPAPPTRAEPATTRETVTPQAPPRPAGIGLVNGRGAVNGTGLVNGRGAVNGTGFTNGTRGDVRGPSSSTRSKRVISRWQFLALLVALVVIIPTFMYLTYSHEGAPITIDGNFDDWSHVTAFGMFQNSATDRTNVTEWAVKTDDSNLYVYIATRGAIMSSDAVDSYFVFVDADGDDTTGYLVSGIGADYRVEFDGWNGSLGSSSSSRFVSADRYDWNQWEGFGSSTAVLGTDRLEGVAGIPSLGDRARYVLVSQSEDSAMGISYAISEGTPILTVHQDVGPGLTSGIAPNEAHVYAMRLTLSCQGGSGTVTSIVPVVSGATPIPLSIGSIDISPGSVQVVDVAINTLSWATGGVINVSVVSSDVTSSFDSVAVTGEPVKAYIGAAPSSIHIDGAFADWAGRTEFDTDSTSMKDPNVDISAVGAVNTTIASSFYASVEGEMCAGSFVPAQITKPTGSSGGSVIPTKKSGEDILRIFLDTDLSESTGSIVTYPSKTIGADYLIEVRGLNGKITSTSISRFSSGAWATATGVVNAANDENEVELSISSASISGASSIDFIIEMSDWRGWSDMATSVPQGTRSADLPGTRAWIVDPTINSGDASATSNQRKLFHDGTNFWSVYVDGGDAVARYSTDGMTWTLDARIFKTDGVIRPSIWYDPASYSVFVIGDRATATVNVYLQKGTVSPATHTIAWSAADRVLPVSTMTMGTKNTFISRDASGYLWIMTSNCTTTTPTRYDLSVFRSTAVNSVAGTWTLTGSMQINSPQPTAKGCVVPAGTGSDMWAVYITAGTVASSKYTGTWGAPSVLYTPAALGGNTEDAIPSAVVDGKGILHVVYGDDHEQPTGTSKPHIFYRYNTGSSWSAALALSSTAQNYGFKSPTISLDISTGNLVVFWYDMQTQYVVAMKNVSGTWSSLTLNPQTADPKAHLSSIYSAPVEWLLCYQWTQNTSAPIYVIFDKIPEFSDAALPALGMAAIIILVAGTARRRKPKN